MFIYHFQIDIWLAQAFSGEHLGPPRGLAGKGCSQEICSQGWPQNCSDIMGISWGYHGIRTGSENVSEMMQMFTLGFFWECKKKTCDHHWENSFKHGWKIPSQSTLQVDNYLYISNISIILICTVYMGYFRHVWLSKARENYGKLLQGSLQCLDRKRTCFLVLCNLLYRSAPYLWGHHPQLRYPSMSSDRLAVDPPHNGQVSSEIQRTCGNLTSFPIINDLFLGIDSIDTSLLAMRETQCILGVRSPGFRQFFLANLCTSLHTGPATSEEQRNSPAILVMRSPFICLSQNFTHPKWLPSGNLT